MIGYLLGLKDGVNSLVDFVFMTIGLLLLPAILIILLGIIFILTFMILGYFIFLALISPKTAENILRDVIESRSEES